MDERGLEASSFSIDVVFHPSVIQRADQELSACVKANTAPIFTPFLVELALAHIERDYVPMILSRSFHRMAKSLYKGPVQPDKKVRIRNFRVW